jgi:hypothetical protein
MKKLLLITLVAVGFVNKIKSAPSKAELEQRFAAVKAQQTQDPFNFDLEAELEEIAKQLAALCAAAEEASVVVKPDTPVDQDDSRRVTIIGQQVVGTVGNGYAA